MDEVLENINKILSNLGEVIAEYNDKPLAGSQFEKEYSAYPDKARINEPFAFAHMNLGVGQEYLAVLSNLVKNNNVNAGAVIARAILELSSLTIWFLEPSIDKTERVKRGLIHLCDGKDQLRKLGDDTSKVDDFFDNKLPGILAKLGIEFRDNKGRVVQPHKLKPRISELITKAFGDKSQYSFLSGIAHGQSNSFITSNYDVEKAVTKEGGMKEVKRKPNKQIAMYALMVAVNSYNKALETYFNIAGWDFTKVKSSFENFNASLSAAYSTSKL